MFEHCSISRYHAALYWKEQEKKDDDNGFFYLSVSTATVQLV